MRTAWATAKDKYTSGNYIYLFDYILLIALGSSAAVYLFNQLLQIS